MKDVPEGLPIWTSEGKTGGLDPLAMLAPIESIYTNLLSGMSSVTVRIRYYSFLVWWIRDYGRNSPTNSPSDVRDHVRKGEALIGLASHANGNSGGLAGEITFRSYMFGEPQEFDMAALREEYLKTPAFNAVYGAQMAEMGILKRNKAGLLAPTKALGLPLAKAFEEAIGEETANRFRKLAQNDFVTISDLKNLKPMGVNFDEPMGQTEEQQLLRHAFVGRIGQGARRNTILEILKFAQGKQAFPSDVELRFKWLDELPGEDHPHYSERLKWAHFQIADSLRLGMEALLRLSVKTLAEHGPIGFVELISNICSEIPESQTFHDFLLDREHDVEGIPLREVQELAIREDADIGSIFSLIARLWVSWADKVDDMETIFPPRGHFTTSATEMKALTSLQGQPAQCAVADFLRYRILGRHLFVAARKLRFQGNQTFQFEYEFGNVIARRVGAVAPSGPRLGTAISFLSQLGFLDDDEGPTNLALVELQQPNEI